MTGYDRRSLVAELRQLTRFGFLVQEGSREANLDAQLEKAWSPWLPPAGFLHFSCKDPQWGTDLNAERRDLRRRAKQWPPPSPVKHYKRATQVFLPAPRAKGDFPRVLLARRTWRQFSSGSVKLLDLATLLWLTWGVQAWYYLPIGRVALKTSPSGGARHPIEAYVWAQRVEGLPSGLYHYAADTHRLEFLKPGGNVRKLGRCLGNQPYFGSSAAVVFMTAVFSRNQWKYEFPRAYRVVLLDAGHLCQTFCLVATWLGLAPFCTHALADSLIEEDLGIDGVSESVLYATGVGVAPSGVDWAPQVKGIRWGISRVPAQHFARPEGLSNNQ
jgi:SagB-type dehydrogenase family enzyme